MTRVEYIRQLEFSLSGKLSKREISEILRDYSEYFEAGRAEGKSEEEISVSLGLPSEAAAQILSENTDKTEQPEKAGHFWDGPWNWLKSIGRRLSGKASDLSESIANRQKKPRIGNGFLPPKTPSEEPSCPASAYIPKHVPARRGIFRKTLYILLIILLLPFAAMFAFAAVMLLFGILCFLIFLSFACILGSVASVLLLLSGVAALSMLMAASGTLPGSILTLSVFGSVALVAGTVFLFCCAMWLWKSCVRLLRTCFRRPREQQSARDPAYRAKTNASRPYGTVDTDDWRDERAEENYEEPQSSEISEEPAADTPDPKEEEDHA